MQVCGVQGITFSGPEVSSEDARDDGNLGVEMCGIVFKKRTSVRGRRQRDSFTADW